MGQDYFACDRGHKVVGQRLLRQRRRKRRGVQHRPPNYQAFVASGGGSNDVYYVVVVVVGGHDVVDVDATLNVADYAVDGVVVVAGDLQQRRLRQPPSNDGVGNSHVEREPL